MARVIVNERMLPIAVEFLDYASPEHESRRQLFNRAIGVLKQHAELKLFEGDAAKALPDVLAKVPAGERICVFQTHVWRQFSAGTKNHLVAALETRGKARAVYFVSALKRLTIDCFAPGYRRTRTLADFEQHGRWIHWLYPAAGQAVKV